MMKAICFKDVKPGDVVYREITTPRRVVRQETYTGPDDVVLRCEEGYHLQGKPDEVIGLVHRPWPEGKTEQDMMNAIRHAKDNIPTVFWLGPCIPSDQERFCNARIEYLSPLREAIEAYELGKPPDEKPRRNESLVDRHMSP